MKNEKDYQVFVVKHDEIDDFGAVMNCAVRYCIGRESYMPRLVIDFIRKHPEMLNAKTIGVMIRDIEKAKDEPLTEWEITHGRTGLGLDYQHTRWLQFRDWLKEQEARLSNVHPNKV